MPRKAKHKTPIIDSAVRLFRRNGYSSTGLNDIAADSGAPKGSIYHFFPGGKAEIAVAAVDEAAMRIAETLERFASSSGSTGEMLKAYVRQVVRWMRMSDYRDGCPITTVMLELAPRNRAVTDAGRRAFDFRISAFEKKLIEDGFARARARRLALLCASSLNGAFVQSRIERTGRPLEIVAEELAELLAMG